MFFWWNATRRVNEMPIKNIQKHVASAHDKLKNVCGGVKCKISGTKKNFLPLYGISLEQFPN